ncbi:hypothetical protein AKJ56_00210 [candidate division MSBL1 archaeon SCGC-AAA382N08]|uniref:Peptidase M20 dimerisation domain-containing protein n=1 Tax=candidate division MSBL1 archaeon SCGC-AAA382N08 TaxID=1698285 RepID=A0A133VQQ9_9EURY|nr:hypothetical protein AKJ56_00210 [candidate division MSBL1 archaeon SCGC-AAA382N08]
MNSRFNKEMKRYFGDLSKLVSFPSVSSDPNYKEEVRKCSDFLHQKFENMGATAKIVETSGHPLVIGDISNYKDAVTVAFYGHYDVQPIASPKEWNTDPFTLVNRNGRFYGRGASDDKGNILTAIKAAELALDEGLDLNFQFIIEGEEESGSPNFENGLKKAREILKPDLIIVADGGWLSNKIPSIEYGLRGLLYMHWNLKTADKNAHSGAVGGPAKNPLSELFAAVCKCLDVETGEIKIPKINESVREAKPGEVEHWTDSRFDIEYFKKSHQLKELRFKDKIEVLKSLWVRPTFEVHGCVGGYMEREGKMTVLPGDGKLHVSMRLVPDQSPEEVFEKVKNYIRGIYPHIEIESVSQIEPYLTDFNSPRVKAAAESLEETFAMPTARIRSGGSIGAVPIMDKILDCEDIIIMSFGLPEHGVHGPNEYFTERMAKGGIKSYLNFFKSLEKDS